MIVQGAVLPIPKEMSRRAGDDDYRSFSMRSLHQHFIPFKTHQQQKDLVAV